jgi:hypothetical protein
MKFPTRESATGSSAAGYGAPVVLHRGTRRTPSPPAPLPTFGRGERFHVFGCSDAFGGAAGPRGEGRGEGWRPPGESPRAPEGRVHPRYTQPSDHLSHSMQFHGAHPRGTGRRPTHGLTPSPTRLGWHVARPHACPPQVRGIGAAGYGAPALPIAAGYGDPALPIGRRFRVS